MGVFTKTRPQLLRRESSHCPHGPHGFVFHSMMMLKDDDDADHNDADDKFSLQMNLSHTIF